jgi:hypothetical protein
VLAAPYPEPTTTVLSLRLRPSLSLLTTASSDGCVRGFDLRNTSRLVSQLREEVELAQVRFMLGRGVLLVWILAL